MSYSDFKTIGAVIKEFQVRYIEANFINPAPLRVSDYFRDDLRLIMQDGMIDNSEFTICENLTYPVFKEIWKHYRQHFIIWSHEALMFDNHLTGFPEYVLTTRSPLSKVVFDKPYLLVVGAKHDNFQSAWAQCLTELITAQRLNENYADPIFGIASNGTTWQFGKLETAGFTRHILPDSIYQLDDLFCTINYLFQQYVTHLEHYSLTP